MKKLLPLLFVFITYSAFAQNDTAITYSMVIHVDSTTKASDLYDRAYLWFAGAFKDSKSVLQIADKESGQLIGKGNIKYKCRYFVGGEAYSGWVHFTAKIFVKKGRYKYVFTNFIHEGTPHENNFLGEEEGANFGLITSAPTYINRRHLAFDYSKYWNDIKATIKVNTDVLIESLNIAMNTKAGVQGDW